MYTKLCTLGQAGHVTVAAAAPGDALVGKEATALVALTEIRTVLLFPLVSLDSVRVDCDPLFNPFPSFNLHLLQDCGSVIKVKVGPGLSYIDCNETELAVALKTLLFLSVVAMLVHK